MENCSVQKIKEIPVSTSIAALLITIYFSYSFGSMTYIPCNNDVFSNFLCSFIHIDATHLIYNLYAVFALSRVEMILGSRQFLNLIFFILIMNSIFETILKHFIHSINCSIGFSGVLFGILFWEIISNNGLDIFILSSIIPLILIPSFLDKNTSLSSHFIGLLTGTISGYIYYKMFVGHVDVPK
jgi:membrane associated rhomboid family serine protease